MSEYSSIIEDMFNERQSAAARTVGSIDLSPDDATRALELSRAMGVPAPVINGDLENFERNNRSAMAGQIVRSNNYIADYINSHPLAAQLSHDDLGNLDQASQSLGALNIESPMKRIWNALKEGYGDEPMFAKTSDVPKPFDQLAKAAWNAAVPADKAGRLLNAATYGGASVIGEVSRALGLEPAKADRLVRDMIVLPQLVMPELARPLGMFSHNEALRAMIDRTTPYVRAGKEVPVGVDPMVDQMRVEQSEADLSALMTAVKDSQSSLTRERNPDMYAGFARQHLGDATIGIQADGIRALYGDKLPELMDELLGWVPRLDEKLAAAEASGGYVEVPTADFLAKVDPQVAKALEDFIRVRPEGVSRVEAKMMAEREPPAIEEPARPITVEDTIRQAAGTETSTKLMADKIAAQALPERGVIVTTPDGSEVRMVPTEKMSAAERDIAQEAKQIIDRILGADKVDILPADQINFGGKETPGIRGLSVDDGILPVIAYAVNYKAPLQVVRHEAIHQILNWGLLTPEELNVISTEALTKREGKDWLDKHGVRERYAKYNLDESALIEEAFAEEFGKWGEQRGRIDKQIAEYSPMVEHAFEKIYQFFEMLYAKLEQLFGHPPEVKDIFEKIESGEVAKRAQGESRLGAKASDQPMLPGIERIEDRAVFEAANAIGMTKDQYRRYMRLIEQRQKEDLEASAKRALEEQRRRQTKEWKQNYNELRPQVSREIDLRPDVMANKFFGQNELNGKKVEPVKIGEDYITPEQKAMLPKSYVAKRGVRPDDIAPQFGYETGSEMIAGMAAMEAERKGAGLSPTYYYRRLVDSETERQMEARYGKLAENILEDAKEQVLSETQLELLHEDTLAMGLRAGAEFSITKDQMKAWAEERFKALDARDIDSDKFIADAGRAGRLAEDALLKNDPATAFQQRQRQYIAALYAKAALAFEKEKAAFEKTAERLSRKENEAIDKDFMNFSQGLLAEAGYPKLRRDMNELRDSLDKSGFKTLDEFVTHHNGAGWEITIDPDILAGRVKPLEEMTAGEFLEFKEALDSMYHVGREIQKIEVLGQKLDFAEFKDKVLENIRSLPVRKPGARNRLFGFDAELTKMEEVMKDLDLREEYGPLFDAVIRPMAEAKHTEYDMTEKLTRKLKELRGGNKAWQRTLGDTIPQNFLFDPYYGPDGVLFDLTRENMIQIMLNFGNRSNIDKFTRGYVDARIEGKEARAQAAKQLETQLRALFEAHATKEDWEFVQNMWDIWKDWQKASGDMYYNLSGRQPRWIQPEPIQTKHGVFAGGYYPVIYDRARTQVGLNGNIVDPNAMMGPNYYRAATANHYTKERTGFVGAIDFANSLELVGTRMQQMMHDIAYRQAVINANKIISDRAIVAAAKKHYGDEYVSRWEPWLKKVANQFNMDEIAQKDSADLLRRMRGNLMVHALGLNLKVIFSPGVGRLNPKWVMNYLADRSANEALVMEKSRELPHTFRNMDRDFRERLEQSLRKENLGDLKEKIVRGSFWPTVWIEQQFRKITFYESYQKALAEGRSDGEAVAIADSKVRERHGSTGIADLPAAMSGSEWSRVFTMFYGYFSGMYNWQRQIPGQLKRGDFGSAMSTMYGAVLLPAAFGALLFNTAKEDDSWWKTIGKALGLQVAGTLPYARDLANWTIEGNPSRTPLATVLAAGTSAFADAKNWWIGKRIDKPIQHAGNVIGLATGLPLAQVSRTAQFAYDVRRGQQRPRNILEWARGIITGEARLKK